MVKCAVASGLRQTEEVYSAPCCIITLPLGVLRGGAVKFAPPLPARKLEAFARLGTCLMNKVEMLWERRWWPDSVSAICIASLESTPTYHPWPWFIEPTAARKHPLGWATLVCFVTDHFATEVEAMDDAAVTLSAVAALRNACRCDMPEPRAVHGHILPRTQPPPTCRHWLIQSVCVAAWLSQGNTRAMDRSLALTWAQSMEHG